MNVFKPKRRFAADFETLSEEHSMKEGKTRVHGWAIASIDCPSYENIICTSTVKENMLDDFLNECLKYNQSDFYFHNLKFDGNFILSYLLLNGYTNDDKLSSPKTFNSLIDDKGNFYSILVRFEDKPILSEKTGKPLNKINKGTGKKEPKTEKVMIRFLDSLKKIPLPVKDIPKAYGLNIKKLVGDFDYNKPYEIGYHYSELEVEYLKNDVLIVALALHNDIIVNDKTKLTSSGDALDDFKERNPLFLAKKRYCTDFSKLSNLKESCFREIFPRLDEYMYYKENDMEVMLNPDLLKLSLDDWIRKGYRGGWCYVNGLSETEIADGLVFDVNSLYPSVMRYELLPYGKPIKFEGLWEDLDDNLKIEYPLYMIEGDFSFTVKKDHLPSVQLKVGSIFRANEWIKDTGNEIINLTLTNIDFSLLKEHYNIHYMKINGGLAFKGKTGIFNDYIDYWSQVKIQAKKDGNKGLYSLSKRMLNSLYGKFGTNPNGQVKHPYLKNSIVSFTIEEGEPRESIYTPIAVFVTSYARNKTIRSAQCNYDRFYYADTDSIHLSGLEPPKENELFTIDAYQLGAWKCEMVFHKAKYVRQKTYLESPYLKDGKIVENPYELDETCVKADKPMVKCCGLPDGARETVDYDNFIIGAEFTNAKKSPKRVIGGVVLHESNFTLK